MSDGISYKESFKQQAKNALADVIVGSVAHTIANPSQTAEIIHSGANRFSQIPIGIPGAKSLQRKLKQTFPNDPNRTYKGIRSDQGIFPNAYKYVNTAGQLTPNKLSKLQISKIKQAGILKKKTIAQAKKDKQLHKTRTGGIIRELAKQNKTQLHVRGDVGGGLFVHEKDPWRQKYTKLRKIRPSHKSLKKYSFTMDDKKQFKNYRNELQNSVNEEELNKKGLKYLRQTRDEDKIDIFKKRFKPFKNYVKPKDEDTWMFTFNKLKRKRKDRYAKNKEQELLVNKIKENKLTEKIISNAKGKKQTIKKKDIKKKDIKPESLFKKKDIKPDTSKKMRPQEDPIISLSKTQMKGIRIRAQAKDDHRIHRQAIQKVRDEFRILRQAKGYIHHQKLNPKIKIGTKRNAGKQLTKNINKKNKKRR